MSGYDDLRALVVSRETEGMLEWFDAVVAQLRDKHGWTPEEIADSIDYAPEWDDTVRDTGWREWQDDPAGWADHMAEEYAE